MFTSLPSAPRRTRSVARFAGLAALLLVLPGCSGGPGPDADPAAPVTIDVTVSAAAEIYSIPWLVAQRQGYFEKYGVIVENIVPGKGGSATMRTLLDGDIPIGEVSYPSIVQADPTGAELRVVGGGTQGPYPMNFYALASNPRINSIHDVRRWAYTRPNSATDALSQLIPKLAGIPAGRIERLIASSPEYLDRFLQSTITTTKDYAETNPGVVRAINAGYTDAVAAIDADPLAAARLYAEYSGFDVEAALKVVERAAAARTWGGGFDPRSVASAQQGVELSDSDRDPDLCTLFDPQFLPAEVDHSLPDGCSETSSP
ncbi:ABC transporter substrate-binding protein [Nocardia rhamnosiphila]|uniref:ABC transporter substrate-binding protein n=1 Tax=Nocardia rhamnosiphila TaxID=426716 RepID=UPI0033E41FD8